MKPLVIREETPPATRNLTERLAARSGAAGRHNSEVESSSADGAAWALAKIGRARQHSHELQSRIAGWAATANPRPLTSLAEDRLSWEVRLSAFDPPSLGEWALILGDAIHNLRSALDVLVWAHADHPALSSAEAKSIAFPIWIDESSWKANAARVLRTVPDEMVERIRDCQPFQRPTEERQKDGLLLLSELDNRDKHRLALVTTVEPQAAEWMHGIEFADDGASARVPPNVTIHSIALEPSALLLSGATVDPIVRVSGGLSLTMQVGLDPGSGFIGAIQLIENLAGYVTTVVAHVQGLTAPVTPEVGGE